jgi:uncharacterized damage-inducible protein DinB
MTELWTAPPVDRTDPVLVADEQTALEQWLDFHRDTLLWKCAGLTAEQLKQRAVAPSGLTLLGLVRHMAEVERWWFRMHATHDATEHLYFTDASPDADFEDLDGADAAADLETFRAECEASRKAVAGLGLDEQVTCTEHGHRSNERDIRWVYLHMIEEYARHNGHADLLREAIDGTTGD